MSPTIALLTRNNFIAAMLTFHLDVDGVEKCFNDRKENILKRKKVFCKKRSFLSNFSLYIIYEIN